MPEVIVIGGGITGLAAAFELAQRGVPCRVLEASERAGGLILTDHVDGFTIEGGPDSVLAQKPAALELCEALGLGPRIISSKQPRTAYVLRDGRLHALPSPSILGIPTTIRGIAGYDLLSWSARARLAMEPFVSAADPAEAGDESVASFFARRFGSATVPLIAEPLLGGIHAGRADELSIRSLFPRLVEAEARRGSVIRAFRRTRHATRGGGIFRSLSSGMGELVGALERRLPSGTLKLSMPATALRADPQGWLVVAGPARTTARAVILAVPAYVAARLLWQVDPEASRLCDEVPYVSTASVALTWRRDDVPHPLAGSGFVVARVPGAPRITACTWVSSKWSGRAPAGSVLLRAFLGGADDPDAADLPDEDLVEIASREVGAVLGISAKPGITRVYRWIRAGAQHNVGQLARMARLEARLADFPGLFVAGSGFRSIGIPDCVADGRSAAIAATGMLHGEI